MYVTSISSVRDCELNVEGVCGVKIKYLLHEGVGAKRLQLRLLTIDVGGYTSLEKHKHEHEVFILHGKGLVRGGDAETIVKEGNVIFISSWEEHQFRNMGKEKLQFLCTKETVE
jgi:mannose-6-phosphate isomerase-like protein (cupin superfamily)